MKTAFKTHHRMRALLPAVLLFGLAGYGGPMGAAGQSPTERIIVELRSPAPVVVAADAARRAGVPFDEAAHARTVQGSHELFLSSLASRGVTYVVTTTTMGLAGGPVVLPNRFDYLINAIGLEVQASAIDTIRAMSEVKWVSADEPMRLHLDRGVRYIRANDGPGNKTIFTQNSGPATRFDGAGQVIAILDTGIEHTHPAFDTRFDDSAYLQRTGDVRPVRLAGQPYLEGVHHPKVVYSLTLTAATAEDDVGHGTHAGADAAGVMVRAPGPDRLPDTADDVVVEGVAPGALLMNYKICETTFTCVGTANLVTALTDAVRVTDPAGNPKPRATVINMSFGGTAGNPNDASATAANNAALAGAVAVASAGNAGPGENTVGSPSAGRRVISVAAMNDPGVLDNEVDVLAANALRYTVAGASTGAQNDAQQPVSADDRPIKALLMAGAPDVAFPLGQHFVYVGFADTPDQVPEAVKGRIALAVRGSTVNAAGQGSGAFAHKAAEAAAKGALALLVFNNVPGELDAATTYASPIPVYGLSQANGEYLRDTIGFSGAFDRNDPATWGVISRLPVRINPPNQVTFKPATTGFSSRGPLDTFEFVKPDVTAPGQNVYAATIAAGGARAGVPPGTMSDPSRYISASGTSFSGPQVAGAAALVREAMLSAAGLAPAPPSQLRSGAAGAYQQTQILRVPTDTVRSALVNTATPQRGSDGETAMDDGSRGSYIHEVGAGLVHVRNAVDARAQLGVAFPDEFRPTYSFGSRTVINTGVETQAATVTVTLRNITGMSAAGTYSLALVDGGSAFGTVTRPFDRTPGFRVTLSTAAVSLEGTPGQEASVTITATVDGRPAPQGLATAGADATGTPATEFLWVLVATTPEGQRLRMPFYYRAVPRAYSAPSLQPVSDDATPDQVNGVDRDGSYRLTWTFPAAPAEQPCGFSIEEATATTVVSSDDASDPLVAGANAKWTGAAQWVSAPHPATGTLGYLAPYADSQNLALTMKEPVQIPAGVKAQLVFDSFEDVDNVDTLRVEVSRDGGAFAPVGASTGGVFVGGSFTGKRFVDLSEFAGYSIRIGFRMMTGGSIFFFDPANLGWAIDNIQIQTANFTSVATVAGTARTYDIERRATGQYAYRARALFGPSCDASGPASNVVGVAVNSTFPPTAAVTASPNPAVMGQVVTFDASASTDTDEQGCCIRSYFWSFGDGNTRTTSEPVTTYTYTQPGSYRVLLLVRDDDDESDSEEVMVQVISTADISGAGWVSTGTGKGHFGFNFSLTATSGPSGDFKYRDNPGVRLVSTAVHSIDREGNTAVIRGACVVNGQTGFTYELTVVDGGSSAPDQLELKVSNGYTASGAVGGGNIVVSQ